MNTYKLSELQLNQPIINVGNIGHVSHGKSTVVKSLTGKATQTSSAEIERNITINLGFANLKIYYNSELKDFKHTNKTICEEGYKLIKHISFVDCPGHAALMATMISGTQVIDAALLLIAVNDEIPQAQTIGHANVLKYSQIDKTLILFNKIDLFKNANEVNTKIEELESFISGYDELKDKPVVPISAFRNYNTEEILRFLSNISTNAIEKLVNESLKMCVLRSFNINKEGCMIDTLKGGVVGGSIQSGYLKVGEYVGLFPGYIKKSIEGQWQIRPILTKILSLYSEETELNIAIPGGLIGIGLDIDPSLCKQNNLLGSSIIKLSKENISYYIDSDCYSDTIILDIEFIKEDIYTPDTKNIVMIINSRAIKGKIKKKGTEYKIQLEIPILTDTEEKYPILTLHNGVLEIFGLGMITRSKPTVQVILPSQYNNYRDMLPIAYEDINIINDTESLDFDSSLFTLANLKDNILPSLDILKSSTVGIPLPELIIEYDPDKIIWKNFSQYDPLLKTLFDNPHIDINNVRMISLDKIMLPYINYVYGFKSSNDVTYLNGIIYVNIKTKKIKMKLEIVVKNLFKQFNLCDKCKKISSLIVKVQSKIQKICFNCGKRILINEPWTKNIHLD